jgi:very-short-patch-repair endonuclease
MQPIIRGQYIHPKKLDRAKQLRTQMTPAEKLLWQHLRNNRLNGLHFRRQQIIDGFIVDFYCHAARVVIEVDGEVHQNQREYDDERDRLFHNLRPDALITDRDAHLLIRF